MVAVYIELKFTYSYQKHTVAKLGEGKRGHVPRRSQLRGAVKWHLKKMTQKWNATIVADFLTAKGIEVYQIQSFARGKGFLLIIFLPENLTMFYSE